MKINLTSVLGALILSAGANWVAAQETAFTYQGQLQTGGSPANGTYNLTFTLYTNLISGTAVAGLVTNTAVPVTNGLFAVMIDFGPGVFTGVTNWLEIGVETNGGANFTTLAPRQQLTPIPSAIYAGTAGNATGLAQGVAIGAANGSAIDAATTDAFVGGGDNNSIAGNSPNAVIAGGNNNIIQNNDLNSVIAGGDGNSIQHDAGWSAIAGGNDNEIFSGWGGIIGGGGNIISNNSAFSVIAGGQNNAIAVNSPNSAVGGGNANSAGGQYATVPGGTQNQANGNYSFAAGQQAQALHQGAFVWADSQSAPFSSTGNDQFDVRAQGGVNFMTAGAAVTVNGQPVVTNNQAGVTLSGTFSGNGAGLTNLNVQLPASPFFSGTLTASNFLSDSLGDFAAGVQNTAKGGDATVAGGDLNQAKSRIATIGGGANNTASGEDEGGATVSGGQRNAASGDFTTVSGGLENTASSDFSTVGGGADNIVNGQGRATIGGGGFNTNSGQYGTIGGGLGNSISSSGALATIPGGSGNVAGGFASFAAGVSAYAMDDGTFVWADASVANTPFGSTGPNQFLIRAQGGVGINTDNPNGAALSVSGTIVASGTVTANGVLLTSDRNAKENFVPVSAAAVLDKIAALPITEWNYRTEKKSVQHIGPMAQDFQDAFGLDGTDDKHISVVDEGGVALAAIQGLNQKLESEAREKDAQIQDLKHQNDSLAERLNELEAAVNKLAASK